MKLRRGLTWFVVALVLLAAGGFATRALLARKAAQTQLDAPRSVVAIDLTPADVFVVGPAELVRTLAISGGLKAAESAIVKARVAAEVKEISVREGDQVKAGQLLGRLDAAEFTLRLHQAEQQAAAAKAQLDIAERTLKNNRALVEQGFISATALDTSVMSAAGARASLQAAEAAAELARKSVRDCEIRAPLSGIVSQRLVQPGERVALDTRLLEIVDLSRIELEAAVSPDDIAAVAVGSPARLQVDGIAQPVAARVARINPSTQAGTRSVLVYLALEPQPGLRQGLFARGTIELQRQRGLVVPESVLRLDQSRPYVLLLEHGAARQRAVTPGQRGEAALGQAPERAVEISAGLAAGDTVLRASVGAIRDGAPLRLMSGAASAPR